MFCGFAGIGVIPCGVFVFHAVDLLAGLQLAYVAINSPDWADVIIRTRTPVADGVEVYHYSDARRVDVVNEIYSVSVTGEPQRRQVELPVAAGGQGA